MDCTVAAAGFFCLFPLAWFLRSFFAVLKIPALPGDFILQGLYLLIPVSAFLSCVKFLPGKRFPDALDLGKPEGFTFLDAVKSFVLLYVLATAAGWGMNFLNDFFQFGWKPQEIVETGGRMPWSRFAVFAAGSIVLAPVGEELLCRGSLYRILEKILGGKEAVFLASFLFAAMHRNLLSFPSLFIIGILLQKEYRKTGSLLPCILLHAMYNTLGILLLFQIRVSGGGTGSFF